MDNTSLIPIVQKGGSNYQGSGMTRKKKPSLKPILSDTTTGDELINRLRPFRAAMIRGLQQRGVNTFGMKFKTVVATYYNEFSGRTLNVSDFINNIAFKIKKSDDVTGDILSSRVQASFNEINDVVSAIINIFKVARNKYDAALVYGYEPEKLLKDEEVTQAKAAKKVEHSLLLKFRGDHYMKYSEFRKNMLWIFGFALVLWLCYIYD